MQNITFDIETLPDMRPGARERHIEDARVNVKVPSGATKDTLAADLGIHDKETIKFTPRASLDSQWIAEVGPRMAEPAGDEAWRKTALDGARGQVLMIGIANDDDDVAVICEGNERDTLARFFSEIGRSVTRANNGNLQFIGHNIIGFDLKFVLQRAIINGVKPHLAFPIHPAPWSDRVFDTMIQWAGTGNRISLNDLCSALDIEGKGDIDGSMVYDYYAAGKVGELLQYCANDVTITREVWRRMSFHSRLAA
jgi:hypothetical protein